MANAIAANQLKAVQNYVDAAKLAKGEAGNPSTHASALGNVGNTSHDGFKSTLSHMTNPLLNGIKQTGATTEQHLMAQVLGTGNVGSAATSLQELSTHLDIVTQALRIGIEKINELTTRSMGG